EQDPHHLAANNRLSYLLGVEGRCWEAVPFLLEAVRQRQFTLHHLVLLGALEPVIDDPALVRACRTDEPRDLLPLVGAARTAIKQNQMPQATLLLREVVAAVPQCSEAQAWLGSTLVDSPVETIRDWEAGLTDSADKHPEIWMARGRWAGAHDQPAVAVRCFLEAARLDSDHRLAHAEAGQAFRVLNQPELARDFLDRAERLRRLGFLVDEIYKVPQNTRLMQEATELTESLGRLWEAWAWCDLALQLQPDLSWAQQTGSRLQSQLGPQVGRTVRGASPAANVELANYPLPAWEGIQRISAPIESSAVDTKVAFRDMAAAAGLNFTYLQGADANTGQQRMLDTTGGGVAVLDYDGDGWADVYFTQSAAWPRSDDAVDEEDRLFRNLGNGHFQDVSVMARLGDPNYSQGTTVGDFNSDGFPDLYVANFGANRLYQNNGDGTYADVTAVCGISGQAWTTSCVMADLNGDGWPDLYDVNYLRGEDAASSICRKGDELRWCSPSDFSGEQDRLLLNSGDGRFQDVTSAAGIVVPDGKGLGIVAADFDGSGRLSLFVANDAVANFFFANETIERGGAPKFVERALITGLAFSSDALPQACMGVAADDANGDGTLDLFVTNFYEQANTLYLQQPGVQFVDGTRQAGLRDPSFLLLGFGTQFLDGELDGWPDLVITNGHVLDLSRQGTPYQMPPQYLRNGGDGRFHEVASTALGEFFQGKYLGRGLALLDWNRDGRSDFVVSHIGAPAALVTNMSQTKNHFLAVQLRGVSGDRDAIGASVQMKTAGQTLSRQLTAGDGYQASNQRQLIFGLGKHESVGELSIRWPSGLIQVFHDLPVDCEVLFVESRATPATLTNR
ncbi:MAG: CRTAC1 family protein, partial [Planctomycetota bacterium]